MNSRGRNSSEGDALAWWNSPEGSGGSGGGTHRKAEQPYGEFYGRCVYESTV